MRLEALRIDRVQTLPEGLDRLVDLSLREDFRALAQLRDEWQAGTNRFSAAGEALYEARVADRLVAVCGLNRDPYLKDAAVGRVRHMYVEPMFRRSGIAGRLLERILAHAEDTFHRVRLRTDRTDADKFYVAMGFSRSPEAVEATHEKALRNESA